MQREEIRSGLKESKRFKSESKAGAAAVEEGLNEPD